MNFKTLFVKSSGLFSLFAWSIGANAGLLTFNGVEVTALDLNGQVSSFEEFYDYNNSKKWSSNMGLEQSDTVILFTAELNNEFAIFSAFGKYGAGKKTGALFVSYVASSGSMLFMDDPDELVGTNGISYVFTNYRNDGFIYGGLDDSFWSFDLSLTDARNLKGVKYISFADGLLGNASYSELLTLGSTFSVSNTAISLTNANNVNLVSAPSTVVLFMFGLGIITLRKRHTA